MRRSALLETLHEKLLIPGENHHVTFWWLPDKREIHAEAVTLFDAANPTYVEKRPKHPAARKLFVVHKGDALRTVHEGKLKLVIVRFIKPSEGNKKLFCQDHTCADPKDDFTLPFSLLLERETRPVYVDTIGATRDRGPIPIP